MALTARNLCLELVREPSHEALRHIDIPDVAIVDGDHNYYTVSGELRLIAERSTDGELPLLILHDVGWPHARRDTYFEPEQIPEDRRQPMVEGPHLVPEEPGTTDRGLLFHWAAEREGGARNGVLTAAEDFVAEHEGLDFAVVPIFFGIGVIWRRDAPYAQAVADHLAPFDRNPVLEWLEANRVHNLARRNAVVVEVGELAGLCAAHEQELAEREELIERQRRLLRALLDSRTFASVDRLSGIARPGRERSWREEVRHALGENSGSGEATAQAPERPPLRR